MSTSRRYRIVHHTTMRYEGEVTASHNELRMTPANEPGQVTLEARVRVRPLTWSHVYEDHWGTQVMAMEAQTAHEVLEIEATISAYGTSTTSETARTIGVVAWPPQVIMLTFIASRLKSTLTGGQTYGPTEAGVRSTARMPASA